jgi:hypothetical protein
MLPFGVGEVTGITQLGAVVSGSILARPHRRPLPIRATSLESHPIQLIQLLSGRTLSPGINPFRYFQIETAAAHA